MANLTSQLAVRLIDGVTAPARGAAKSIREIGRSAKAVDGTRIATSRLGAAAGGVAARLAGAAAGAVSIGAIAAGARAAVVNFADLERRMLRVGITADATNDEIAKATASLREMSQIPGMPAMDKLVEGVDTLVTQGKNLPESLAMIRAIAQTAAASGAEVSDISATAGSVSSSMGIMANRMQAAFDVMVAGGKAGKFELKDMARYLPSLAPAAAAVGLKGEEGLRSLVAYLQVVRNMTGNTEEAASSMNNIFAKMESDETAKRFSKMGIDLRKAMADARKEGKPLLDVFVQLADKAVKGDLSKLPQLFQDMELARGMRALMSQKGAVDALRETLSKVDGATLTDFGRVAEDTTSKIDGMRAAWDGLLNRLGKGIAPAVTPVLDEVNKSLTRFGSEMPIIDPNRRGELPGGGRWRSKVRNEAGREAQDAAGRISPSGLEAAHALRRNEINAQTWQDRWLPDNRIGTPEHDAWLQTAYQRSGAKERGGYTANQSIEREDVLAAQIRRELLSMVQQMRTAQTEAQKQAVSDAFSGSLTKALSEWYSLNTSRNGQEMVGDTEILNNVRELKDAATQSMSQAGTQAGAGFGAGLSAAAPDIQAKATALMNSVRSIMEAPLRPNVQLPQMTVPGGSPAIIGPAPVGSGKQSNASGPRGAVTVNQHYALSVHGQTDPRQFAADVQAQSTADARKALRGIQADVGPDFG